MKWEANVRPNDATRGYETVTGSFSIYIWTRARGFQWVAVTNCDKKVAHDELVTIRKRGRPVDRPRSPYLTFPCFHALSN